MHVTYIGSSNNTVATATLADGSTLSTAGQPLGDATQDVLIYKIIIGLPVANGNIVVKNKAVSGILATDTSDIVFKATIPGTISSSFSYAYPTVYDFGDQTPLQVDGGNVIIDQTMQVTVIWQPASEQQEG
jgi:hypothetical protein